MLTPGRKNIGSLQRLTARFVGEDGEPTDPDTVTFMVRSPCGSESTFVYGVDGEVGKSAVGRYFADVTPDRAGRWHIRWATTGPVYAKDDNFVVQVSAFDDDCFSDYT